MPIDFVGLRFLCPATCGAKVGAGKGVGGGGSSAAEGIESFVATLRAYFLSPHPHPHWLWTANHAGSSTRSTSGFPSG